jgi:hypothetical protein
MGGAVFGPKKAETAKFAELLEKIFAEVEG